MTNSIIFLNGIPVAGKSTVAREIEKSDSHINVITGDDIVQQVPYEQRVNQAHLIWSRMLDVIEQRSKQHSVLVDAALRADQVIEARDRFGSSAAFVILRIDEATRSRRQRERDRRGNPLGHPWRPEFHSMPGGDDLYDLVIDAGASTPRQCAQEITEFIRGRWPNGRL